MQVLEEPQPGWRAMLQDDGMNVRPMTVADWGAVELIYAEGIATGDATFETEPPDWERFTTTRLPHHRHVAIDPDAGEVLGWAACSPISTRDVYRGVVEHSVYVAAAARGRGVGRVLLDALLATTEAAGIWTIQSGIFPENTASLRLHVAVGFRQVGTRERLGCHQGRWHDVLLLERRSPVIGVGVAR